MNEFLIYSKPDCPFCVKIKHVMELRKLPHKIYTLGEEFTKEEFYEKFGEGSTFPQVIHEDVTLGGCVDTIKYLKQKGLI